VSSGWRHVDSDGRARQNTAGIASITSPVQLARIKRANYADYRSSLLGALPWMDHVSTRLSSRAVRC
jgi:hypothetical protein